MNTLKEIVKSVLFLIIIIFYYGVLLNIQEKSVFLFVFFLIVTIILNILLVKKILNKPNDYIFNSVVIGWVITLNIEIIFEIFFGESNVVLTYRNVLEELVTTTSAFMVIGAFMKFSNNRLKKYVK